MYNKIKMIRMKKEKEEDKKRKMCKMTKKIENVKGKKEEREKKKRRFFFKKNKIKKKKRIAETGASKRPQKNCFLGRKLWKDNSRTGHINRLLYWVQSSDVLTLVESAPTKKTYLDLINW